MTHIRINQAAALLGVSDDTVRRWCDGGRLNAGEDESGRRVIDGAELAEFAQELATEQNREALDAGLGRRSSRNHFTGLVTKVVSDDVMSQVDLQCGPFRVVALISTEAVTELGIAVGSVSTAVVKATNVSIEQGQE